ncbi:hypothetical protein HMPREF3038_02422 [Akkermansia sp. KLE1797]|nr:hypothetical protein HMPREF3038_02422 [Akkermansia sp. KLE1797]KXU54846.1 hypothetical protein HMPREF3039_00993 [Akkermansia sp. KLE1798]KZA06230.1 hypothetical protein HMPREF1326_00078 [Akkermansia sp. KLE1605]
MKHIWQCLYHQNRHSRTPDQNHWFFREKNRCLPPCCKISV